MPDKYLLSRVRSFYRVETYRVETPCLHCLNRGWPMGLLIFYEPRRHVRNVSAQPGYALVLAPGKDCGTHQHPYLPFEQSQVLSGFVNNRDIVYHEEDGSFLQTTSPNVYIGFDSS